MVQEEKRLRSVGIWTLVKMKKLLRLVVVVASTVSLLLQSLGLAAASTLAPSNVTSSFYLLPAATTTTNSTELTDYNGGAGRVLSRQRRLVKTTGWSFKVTFQANVPLETGTKMTVLLPFTYAVDTGT